MNDQLTKILNEKGVIVEDFENVNGRFVTVLVEDARMVAWDLCRELPLAFPKGYFSKAPTYWSAHEYSVQANSKRPALVLERAIYPAGSFGDTTRITIQGGR